MHNHMYVDIVIDMNISLLLGRTRSNRLLRYVPITAIQQLNGPSAFGDDGSALKRRRPKGYAVHRRCV